jgi:hypothetical protein
MKHYSRWKRHGDVAVVLLDRRPAIEKVWDKVVEDPVTGCLLWTGYRSQAGYGYLADQGTVVLVHRLIWQEAKGPIPDGMEIDHLCFTRNCLNLQHLDLVTPSENKRRMLQRVVTARTHCPHGHPYDGDNLRIEADGHRRCETCRTEQAQARNARRRRAS